MTFRIIRCTSRHFDRMVDFVSRYNPLAEHHVGYFGLAHEDIRHAILMLNFRYDRGFRLAQVGQELVGVMGVDFDRNTRRAWLYGPIVVSEPWMETAEALYEAVIRAIPADAGIREYEIFVDSRNVNCRALAERHDFTALGEFAICAITPERLAALPEATVAPWDGRHAGQFAALHAELFPRSNYTLDYILEEVDKGAVFLAESDGDQLAGYFFGHVAAGANEAYVELVGVNPDYRRTGLGRRLMLAGLARLRQTPGLSRLSLTVGSDNEPALRLYDSLGFVREQDMMGFRKRVTRD